MCLSIGSNNAENRKEMKDIQVSIQNLGSVLRQDLATFKEEMGIRFEAINRRMEAQGRDIADIQERVVETEEWNAEQKGILASSIKQQCRLREKETVLEGRSRRNNIRVCPEGTEDLLPKFIERLICEKLKFGEDASLQIQHAYRAFAPKNAPDKNPRAIIVNFLQYQTMDDILKKAWQTKIEIFLLGFLLFLYGSESYVSNLLSYFVCMKDEDRSYASYESRIT